MPFSALPKFGCGRVFSKVADQAAVIAGSIGWSNFSFFRKGGLGEWVKLSGAVCTRKPREFGGVGEMCGAYRVSRRTSDSIQREHENASRSSAGEHAVHRNLVDIFDAFFGLR